MRWALPVALLLVACPSTKDLGLDDDPPVEVRPDTVVVTSSTGVTYEVGFEARGRNYLEVEGVFPTRGQKELVLFMPVWTPGSYLVREFMQHVVDFEARSDRGPLSFRKTRKNRITVALDGSKHVAVRYRVYARHKNVRGNYVDDSHAVINGAPTFFADLAHTQVPYRVRLTLPDDWKRAVSGMTTEGERFVAPDYDTLVDSPIVAGNPAVHRFEVEGVEHLLVNSHEGAFWDGEKSKEGVRKVTEEIIDFWGVIPYRRYVYLNVINEARGGLEHKNSTLMMTDRWKTRTDKAYRGWLGLVAHEFFHTWNGKRLRPNALGPFDYENEVYTDDLWIVEGLTSFYDDLILVRAGLMTEAQYLEVLSGHIARHEAASGKLHTSLAQASYDTWIEFYRWDENSPNTTISYYTKGAIVGFLLDTELRRATNENADLDQVMRQAYAEFSQKAGYRSADFYNVVEHFGGQAVRDELVEMVETTRPLPYSEALKFYGLEFAPPEVSKKAHLGVKVERKNGRLVVTMVMDGTGARMAGVNVDDEIIAIDGIRVRDLGKHLSNYKPEDTVELTIARHDRLQTLKATLQKRPREKWTVRRKSHLSATQLKRLDRLFGRE